MRVLKRKITEVELEKINVSGEVDRIDVDEEKISELKGSIREVGLLQPILLRPLGDKFEIVAGRRRWLACSALGVEKIDAIIREMSDHEAAIIRATENLARENLSAFEEAKIFENLIKKYNMEHEEIGEKFGYKPGTVRRRLDLLKMPHVLSQAVHKHEIGVTVAEELWPINDEGDLNYYLRFAIESGCTAATARGWCKDWKSSKRREKTVNDEGGGAKAVGEPRPVYIACDLCEGPMELGKETLLRLCDSCHQTIKANM